MNKVLVPIQNFSRLSLSASYFAIKFAERNPAKDLFLIFSKASLGEGPSTLKKEEEMWQREFDGLIQQARTEKIHLELFFSSDEYLGAVSRFAQDHNPTEIIVALPQVQDPAYPRLIQEVNQLRDQVENQIILVKPKEETDLEGGKEFASRKPFLPRPRIPSEKKGS
jgi:hypothetical protein